MCIFFIFAFIFWTKSLVNSIECEYDSGTCIFNGVHTTEKDPYFHPIAPATDLKIIQIEFHFCQIHTLTEEICETFPNVEKMLLRDSFIQNVSDKALNLCKKLKMIDLSNNLLRKLPDGFFQNNV